MRTLFQPFFIHNMVPRVVPMNSKSKVTLDTTIPVGCLGVVQVCQATKMIMKKTMNHEIMNPSRKVNNLMWQRNSKKKKNIAFRGFADKKTCNADKKILHADKKYFYAEQATTRELKCGPVNYFYKAYNHKRNEMWTVLYILQSHKIKL